MNILFVSFLQPDAPSGVRVHYLQLAALLRERGHQVDLVTTATLTGWRRHVVAAVRHGLHRLGPSARALAMDFTNFLLIKWGIDAQRSYGLVHAHDVGSGVAASQALAGRVPVVVTGHFNDHPGEELVLQQGLTGAAAQRVVRWYNFLLARTTYFISVSAYVRNRTVPWLPAEGLHTLVHNGIDLAAFGQALPDAELLQLARGRHVLLNTGYLEARKNQLFLLRVAQALRVYRQDFVVAFAGHGPDEAALRQQIEQDNLQEVAVLLGHRDDVAPLLRASDLYVHTANRENCPLVLLEAMACGVPVLARAVGGIPEVLAATPAALLPPDASPEAVAQMLHQLLSSPAARADLRQRQAAYAAAHFDAHRMADATLAFYQDAARHFRSRCPRPQPATVPLESSLANEGRTLTT